MTSTCRHLQLPRHACTVESYIYPQAFRFQGKESNSLITSISHIPGHLNVQADGLSRFKQPLPVDLDPVGFCDIHWKALLKPPGVFVAENGRKWPQHFDIQHCEKELWQSADCG